MLGAFLLLRLQQSVRSGEPTIGLRVTSLEEQRESHPEHAPCGPPSITGCDMDTMGALQCAAALVRMAEEIRRRCQQLEIVPRQRTRVV
jgi:hypothetical protein